MRTGINNLTDDELREADDALNPYSFEKYCGACIHFNTEECPHLGKVCETTEWTLKLGASRKGKMGSREKIKCNKFYD